MSETQPLAANEHLTGEEKLGKRKCVSHLKRFWWLHLTIWLIIIITIILLTIFVIVPHVAQTILDDAKLEIQQIRILDSKPQSYWIQVDSTIKSTGVNKASLDPFKGNLTLEGIPNARPFVTLDFPATSAADFQTVNISQRAFVEDLDSFIRFNSLFFRNETLRVKVYGKTKVRPRGMSRKYGVTFSKVVEFKGLDLLKGTQLEDTELSFSSVSPNFNATAKINNPSFFAIDIGNVTFDTYAGGDFVGNLTATNLLLRPGVNTVDVTSRVNQSQVLNVVSKPAFCETGVVPFNLEGTEVSNNKNEIPWLQSALSSANQTVNVNVGALLGSSGSSDFCA